MIAAGRVEFVQQDPYGGEQRTSIDEDLFRVLVAQSHSLEELRCLWFGFCHRETANANRKAAFKAAGGTA
jgi:hypothetical protein